MLPEGPDLESRFARLTGFAKRKHYMHLVHIDNMTEDLRHLTACLGHPMSPARVNRMVRLKLASHSSGGNAHHVNPWSRTTDAPQGIRDHGLSFDSRQILEWEMKDEYVMLRDLERLARKWQ